MFTLIFYHVYGIVDYEGSEVIHTCFSEEEAKQWIQDNCPLQGVSFDNYCVGEQTCEVDLVNLQKQLASD